MHTLMLDYDGISEDEVKADVGRLLQEYPHLGYYTIKPSKTADQRHFHVEFPKSALNWEEALAIAKETKADKDWLQLSEQYGSFALIEETGKTVSKELRIKKFPAKPKKEPVQEFKQPVILVLDAETWDDHGRLRAICESITDETWEYREGLTLHDLKAKLRIGCRDVYQAKRRIAFLERSGVKFQWEIVSRDMR